MDLATETISELTVLNANYKTGIAGLTAWSAQLQALHLAHMSKKISKYGYLLDISRQISGYFCFSIYHNTLVFHAPGELMFWFLHVPWRTIQLGNGRLYLTTKINDQYFCVVFKINSAITASMKINDDVNIAYLCCSKRYEKENASVVLFNKNELFNNKDEYYELF